MEENEVGALRKESVDGIKEESYVWGPKLGSTTYKSVTIRGETLVVGDCVRCSFESKPGHIGKIMKLSQLKDRKVCKVRRFYSLFELSPSAVQALGYTPQSKERFLASGEGPGVEDDMSLEEIASRCIIFCTAKDEDGFNEIPSDNQIESADYFFHKAYDPENKEVVELDSVVEAIGAQKVFNRREWLLAKIPGRSFSQIESSSRVLCQSPASVSSHQDAACAQNLSVPEVSPAPSRESTEQRTKKRKSTELVSESQKLGVIEEQNEVHTPKRSKVESPKAVVIEEMKIDIEPEEPDGKKAEIKGGGVRVEEPRKAEETRAEGLQNTISKPVEMSNVPTWNETFRKQKGADDADIWATSRDSREAKTGADEKSSRLSLGLDEKTLRTQAPSLSHPSTSARKISNVHTGTSSGTKSGTTSLTETPNDASSKPPINSSAMEQGTNFHCASPSNSKELKKGDVDSSYKKDEDVARGSNQSHRQSSSPALDVPARKENLSTAKELIRPGSPREELSTILTDRPNDAPNAQQEKRHRQVPKARVEDWDASIVPAIQGNRVLLLKNVDPGLHSDDLAEAFTAEMRMKCEVRIAPPVSFNYNTTSALLKLPSAKKADEFLHKMESSCVVVANRPLTATRFDITDFKKSHPSKYPGHLDLALGRDFAVEDPRSAVTTSHLAQGNTIEFAFGVPWRVLDEQHQLQWQILQDQLVT
uniref:BAH domain-containing protein n=1 Tax=Physcomitrium patens TaxID=3218 RepID=A0A7I4B4U6_PHYPA